MLLLSPGQGAQSSGMLASWLARPGAAETVARWSALTGLDLVQLGTRAGSADLRPTEVAQPLLTATALLSGRAVLDGALPSAVCGHSVGELSALALAGVLTDDEAVVLAAERGRLMARAAAARPTGLVALLGGTVDPLPPGLELATVNAPGQLVLGGTLEALAAWTPPAGVRVRRLDVAGAFHTSAMEPAVADFARLVVDLTPQDARCDVVANADGAVLRDGRALLDRLVAQLTSPVRFDLCLQALPATAAVELAPAGVLAGLVKRGRPDLSVTALRTADDLLVPA